GGVTSNDADALGWEHIGDHHGRLLCLLFLRQQFIEGKRLRCVACFLAMLAIIRLVEPRVRFFRAPVVHVMEVEFKLGGHWLSFFAASFSRFFLVDFSSPWLHSSSLTL